MLTGRTDDGPFAVGGLNLSPRAHMQDAERFVDLVGLGEEIAAEGILLAAARPVPERTALEYRRKLDSLSLLLREARFSPAEIRHVFYGLGSGRPAETQAAVAILVKHAEEAIGSIARPTPPAPILRRSCALGFELVETRSSKGNLTFTGWASTEAVDSFGDIVRAAGWELDRFTSNPVLLFSHDPLKPVGTVTLAEKVAGKGLRVRGEVANVGWVGSDLLPLVRGGVVKGLSVGFRGRQSRLLDESKPLGGREFLQQELLEVSLCTLPSNPETLLLETR